MCGLAGILHFDPDRPVDPDLLRRMLRQVAYRGPDATGLYKDGPLGLAHARLSIIDVEGGDQPIHNEDRTVWTVFNGEIFNHVELRKELEASGHRFYTRSDTEVLVHAYEQYGDDLVHRLNGQYSFAIWDGKRRRLLLVRDRPGILPMYVHRAPDRLVFGSEVKAILPALETSPRLNPRALDQILTFWAPVSPETIFDGIEELGPGEMMIVEGGEVRRQRYWDWHFPLPGEHRVASDRELAEELLALLVDATRLRLRSDVPVGVYLSGGLDSSGIAALVHDREDVDLSTFSITFEDPALDERAHQVAMVEHLGSDHHLVQARRSDIAERFPDTIRHTETPILRTAPVPMGILSALVHREGFKVVLTGEGADEVLGGYDIFKEAKIRQFWARRPESEFRASLLQRLYPYLDLGQRRNAAFVRQFFGQALDQPDLPFFSHLPRWFTTARTKEFLSPEFKAALGDEAEQALMARMPEAITCWHPFNRAQYIEAKTLMAGYLLCSQGDRMLMSSSVEGRFPYLDHRLMEFANALHPKHKMRGLNEKSLLKRALAPYLPSPILSRYKQPYRAPDIGSFFMEGGPPAYVGALLSADAVRNAGYFDPDRVARLIKKIEAGRAIGAKDNMAFVGILSTQIWHETFVNGFGDFR